MLKLQKSVSGNKADDQFVTKVRVRPRQCTGEVSEAVASGPPGHIETSFSLIPAPGFPRSLFWLRESVTLKSPWNAALKVQVSFCKTGIHFFFGHHGPRSTYIYTFSFYNHIFLETPPYQ